jgi:hypothetical protein
MPNGGRSRDICAIVAETLNYQRIRTEVGDGRDEKRRGDKGQNQYFAKAGRGLPFIFNRVGRGKGFHPGRIAHNPSGSEYKLVHSQPSFPHGAFK